MSIKESNTVCYNMFRHAENTCIVKDIVKKSPSNLISTVLYNSFEIFLIFYLRIHRCKYFFQSFVNHLKIQKFLLK